MSDSIDVFISYSSKDEEIAVLLHEALNKRSINSWVALYDVNYGGNYAREIFDAIEQAKVFSVIISANSCKSDHVKNEIELATRQIQKGLIIMPIRIDKEEMDKEMQYYLARKQWLDASNPPLQEKIEKYCDQVYSVLHIEQEKPNSDNSDIPSEDSKEAPEQSSDSIENANDSIPEEAVSADSDHQNISSADNVDKNVNSENAADESEPSTDKKLIFDYEKYASEGDFKTAIALLEENTKLADFKEDKQLGEKYNTLGVYYIQVNDYNKALEYLKKAVPLVPEHAEPSVHNNIASAYMGLEEYEEAIKEYTEALLQERLVYGWQRGTRLARSVAFYKAGRFEEAQKDYQEAMANTETDKVVANKVDYSNSDLEFKSKKGKKTVRNAPHIVHAIFNFFKKALENNLPFFIILLPFFIILLPVLCIFNFFKKVPENSPQNKEEKTVWLGSPVGQQILNFDNSPLYLIFNKRRIELGLKTSIGRQDDNDLVIAEDRLVSRHHCIIQKIKDSYFLKDENSTNGTFLNGCRIPSDKYVKLNNGDRVSLGYGNIIEVHEYSGSESQ